MRDVLCVRKALFRFFINILLEIFHKPYWVLGIPAPAAVECPDDADIRPMTQLPCLTWLRWCSSASYGFFVFHIFQRIFSQRWPKQRSAHAWVWPSSRFFR